MDDLHLRLAQIAFAAGDDLGLVLAGGYALAQYALTSRPSQDVDLATASVLPLQLIADRLAQAYEDAGFTVGRIESTSRMARLEIRRTIRSARSTCSRRP